jgi:hypothetical protein
MFENRMLRRIFGPEWDKATGGWRKLHNGSFINFRITSFLDFVHSVIYSFQSSTCGYTAHGYAYYA